MGPRDSKESSRGQLLVDGFHLVLQADAAIVVDGKNPTGIHA